MNDQRSFRPAQQQPAGEAEQCGQTRMAGPAQQEEPRSRKSSEHGARAGRLDAVGERQPQPVPHRLRRIRKSRKGRSGTISCFVCHGLPAYSNVLRA